MKQKVSNDREYVLISSRNKGDQDKLLFWGSLTWDDEQRSFSGYTHSFTECERYTLDEIMGANFPKKYLEPFDKNKWANFEGETFYCTALELIEVMGSPKTVFIY